MDKAAIFHAVTRRNALRRENGLPLLNVQHEYAHEDSVASHHEYQAECQEHAGEREIIRQQVMAEYQARFGPDFGGTMGGRWAVGHLTHQRFTAYMADKYALVQPDGAAARYPIMYGGANK